MNYIVSILFFIVTFLSNGCSYYTKVRVPVKEMGLETVALNMAGPAGDPYTFCTAVWISANVLLTANHCVDAVGEAKEILDTKGLEISYSLENEVAGFKETPNASHLSKVLATDSDHDLALLKVMSPIPDHRIAKIAASSPDVGDDLYFTGHPSGLTYSYVRGMVSAYRNDLPVGFTGPFMQISAPIWHGMSGGGAFNDKGELVGIVSFMMKVPQTGFCIHHSTIKSFINNKI